MELDERDEDVRRRRQQMSLTREKSSHVGRNPSAERATKPPRQNCSPANGRRRITSAYIVRTMRQIVKTRDLSRVEERWYIVNENIYRREIRVPGSE